MITRFYGELRTIALAEEEPFLIWILDPLYIDEVIQIMEDTKKYDEEQLVDTLLGSGKVAFYDKYHDAYYTYKKHLEHPYNLQLVQYLKLLADDGPGYMFFLNDIYN